MVRVSRPPRTDEEIRDVAGAAMTDGLSHDDTADEFNVSTGANVSIDGSGNVQVTDTTIEDATLKFSDNFAPGF